MTQLPALTNIEKALTSDKALTNLKMALGANSDLEQAKMFCAGILNEIRRSEGQEYGDLTKCSTDSIIHAMLDAAKFKVAIDGRKHAHLEVRWNKDRKTNEAILQIDTNGLVAKIAEHYPDLQVTDVAVFEGDTFEIRDIDGAAGYTHTSKNPFQGVDKLLGIAVQISYTDNGKKVVIVEVVSKTDLLAMQAKAKGFAWKEFPIERMRTAAIKRACKWSFRKITGLREIIDYDNTKNFDLNKAAANSPNIIDNLNKEIAPPKPQAAITSQPEVQAQVIEAEEEIVTEET